MWNRRFLKLIAALACATPLVVLAWKWTHNDLGINSIEFVARYTGRWTLRFLLASLAITPLRRIPGLNGLIQYRRMLGLFAFFYGCLHALHYFGRDVQWNMLIIKDDLTYRRFFIAGMISLLLMAPLAATSFNAAIRKMGGKRWQALHRLAYVSAIAAVIHYLWQGKTLILTPLYYAAILFILLGFRLIITLRKRMTRKPMEVRSA